MSERAVRRMTADEFLEWDQFQADRHELVDGLPVAMVGARRGHDQIVVNAIMEVGGQLRGGPCRVFTGDTAVRIPAGNVRRPDLGVDCGRFEVSATAADSPALVVEVLSPSTREFDMFGKLDEYKTVATLTHIILVDPDAPQVTHWSRTAAQTWTHETIEGLEARVELTGLGVSLPLRALYAGLEFRPFPKLVSE